MNVLDLFSGIGGFSLGLERAGMRTVAFCELDPYCRKVLTTHWPGVPIHDDIRQLDGTRYTGAVDLVCGGYPCQGESNAGKKLGSEDHRWLAPEMCRVIRESRPSWVICENVRGHVRRGFDSVAAQLEVDGFTVWPFIIPACAVAAEHHRERLWIVAHSPSKRRHEAPSPSGQSDSRLSTRTCGTVGGLHRTRGEYPIRPGGFHQPGVARIIHGVPSRMDASRIAALGNAVVPQIPELIGRTILAYEGGLAA